jgi:hypothetical protein
MKMAERIGALMVYDTARKHFVLAIAGLAAAVAALMPITASALVVVSPGTSTTPVDDPGWNNVTASGSGRNYVYLGDGWALSARHVGPQITDPPPQTLQFSTGTFGLIPNQNFVVDNPSTMTLVGGANAADPYETDLRLVRLNGDPGLPSIFDANSKFTIATQAPPVGAQIVIIGHGPGQTGGETSWNSSWQTVPLNTGSYTGFNAFATGQDDTKRWGTNTIENANNYLGNVFPQVLSPTTGVLALTTGDGRTRDIASQILQFNQSSASPYYEAQAVTGDSGSSVFYKSGSNWYLAGIVNTQFSFQNQPNPPTSNPTAVYGDLTSFADLSFYRTQLLNLMTAHHNYSISGDINLDGVVSGDGTGPAATDDVTAFISGWGSSQAVGNITSWKKGDLNLDGKVDVSDFLLLRSAYNTAGAGASLKALTSFVGSSGQGGVPEPSSFLLAATGAAALALIVRQRAARRGL